MLSKSRLLRPELGGETKKFCVLLVTIRCKVSLTVTIRAQRHARPYPITRLGSKDVMYIEEPDEISPNSAPRSFARASASRDHRLSDTRIAWHARRCPRPALRPGACATG